MAAMPWLSCPRRASPSPLASLILLFALAALVAACGSQVAPTASTAAGPNASGAAADEQRRRLGADPRPRRRRVAAGLHGSRRRDRRNARSAREPAARR